ncbi:mitochondrial amidoxime reducing component 2-like [Homalodisca vitripennis]|uniref:mitochondrial amidoxime reducing component 2-like n=1 Tax=Homalodisca vitripennis TaxID=197043 RepID=UPI001EEB5A5C|nr:mitochondrial amidoxime reducing component 2-like [Homalodisca vitripennis]
MKQLESPVVIAASVTLAAVIFAGVFFWRQKKKQTFFYSERSLEEIEVPSKWTKVGEVSDLVIYPLKGAQKKHLEEAQFTERGLREMQSNKISLQDRGFVVFTEDNQFINVKKNIKLLLVDTEAVDEARVRFSFPDSEDLIVKLPIDKSTLNKIGFDFKQTVETLDCGDEAATWFSQRLLNQQTGLRLGCFIKSLVNQRIVKDGLVEEYSKYYKKLHGDYLGAYSDIASYMLMGEESLKDLNNRLAKPVSHINFRPNILVKGSPAFSEDCWDWIKIGDNVFRGFKYCTRCIVTTINPDTAEKDPKFEPLMTLRKYRQVKEDDIRKLENNSPVMGLYAGLHQIGSGVVRIGDPIYVNAD